MALNSRFNFQPLISTPVQIWAGDEIQLYHVLEYCLTEAGGNASVVITTFSTSEEFIRKVHLFKQSGLIKRVSMVADRKATDKTIKLLPFIQQVFDNFFLANNHSKIILIKNEKFNISILTSQNQTRGNRFETGAIFTTNKQFDYFKTKLHELTRDKSTVLYSLYK